MIIYTFICLTFICLIYMYICDISSFPKLLQLIKHVDLLVPLFVGI